VCFLSAWEGAGIGCKKETSHIRIWLVFPWLVFDRDDGGSAAAAAAAGSRIIKTLVQTHHTYHHGPFKLNIFNPKLNYGYFNCRSSTIAKVNRLE
jgi:hypothetical protein